MVVGAIEISRDGVLEKAYFIVPPLCRYLTHETKQAILVGVNRANLQTMLTGFSESFDSLYEEMRHQRKLTESTALPLTKLYCILHICCSPLLPLGVAYFDPCAMHRRTSLHC